MHDSVVFAINAMLDDPVVDLFCIPQVRTISCTISVAKMSAGFIPYRDRRTGSHFGVGGINRMMIPLQFLSVITDPVSPFDPSNCVILMFHAIRLSPLNFCSSERIVNDGVPNDILTCSKCFDYLNGVCLFYSLSCSVFPVSSSV